MLAQKHQPTGQNLKARLLNKRERERDRLPVYEFGSCLHLTLLGDAFSGADARIISVEAECQTNTIKLGKAVLCASDLF